MRSLRLRLGASRPLACAVLALACLIPAHAPAMPPSHLSEEPARPDTVWFGGDDGGGVAWEGGVWDWDAIAGDPLQGWTRVDATLNPAVHFGWVNAAAFAAHGDPCAPMLAGTAGMLWCGVHEDEADCLGYATGMGYGNDFSQSALSPLLAIDPDLEELRVGFAYFNDTEPDCDPVEVRVRCLGAGGAEIADLELDAFTGIAGSAASPALYERALAAGTLPPATQSVRLELRMTSDAGWSDEDGGYDCACGAFALDDVSLRIGTQPAQAFDFTTGAQGWSFAVGEPVGAFMASLAPEVWQGWVPEGCALSGRVLGFVDPADRRHPGRHHEFGYSAPVPRGDYGPPYWNAAFVRGRLFEYSCSTWSVFLRFGYSTYPASLPGCPGEHWSPPRMDDNWFLISIPHCASFAVDLTALPEPLPLEWDSLRLVAEVQVSDEEPFYDSHGAPLLDDVVLGLTHKPDAPTAALHIGHRFQDGFGQRFPHLLEPGDVGNADIVYDLSLNGSGNDHLADSAAIDGPPVAEPEDRWLAELCLRVARKGPRQDWVAAYAAWKQRFAGDPEQGFVAALMDSAQTSAGHASNHVFTTYFHEEDPGFDPRHPDYSPEQEILPDGVFTPGTRIEYAYRTFWYDGGAPPQDYFRLPETGAYEFEILPGMSAAGGYDVVWPSVLYVDARVESSQSLIEPALAALFGPPGEGYDRYDYLDANSCWNASLRRSHVGGVYGNNGCTLDQLLGYRLIVLQTGRISCGAMEANDFALLESWLNAFGCGLGDRRRGLILDGEQAAEILENQRPSFLHNYLGVELIDPCYHEYNNDPAYCVFLEPCVGWPHPPAEPGAALWGSGISSEICFDVLGARASVADVTPTLRYWSQGLTGTSEFVDFAQIVRQRTQAGVADWRSLVDGFSLQRISMRDYGGEACSSDSASVVGGACLLLAPVLEWLADPDDPFLPWRYPCEDAGLDEEHSGHLTGAVDYLYAPQPSPFSSRATIRFRCARAGRASLELFDVAGRRIRTLFSGSVEPGERELVWDGRDDQGRRQSPGAYWARLRSGKFVSSRRLVLLK